MSKVWYVTFGSTTIITVAAVETIAAARDNPRIVPVGTLNPQDTPGWQSELARCRAEGVGVLRFFPGTQNWSVESQCFRRVLDALRGSGVCLVFNTKDCPTGWELSGAVARLTAGLGVPVILTDTSYGDMAETMAVCLRVLFKALTINSGSPWSTA